MFTVFHDELDSYARGVLAEHQDLLAGRLAREGIDALQTERLRTTLRYVRARSPFYRRHLEGLTDQAIECLTAADLAAAVPYTTKDNLREHMFDVPSKPIEDAWVYYETTGTTGPATPCPRDNVDSIVNDIALTVSYREIFDNHGPRHVVAVLGPTELHSTGDTLGGVLRNLGHTVVKMWPHSPVVGFERVLRLLADLRVTAMVCTPGMAVSLAREAHRAGIDPRTRFDLRLILALGELATPALLDRLGETWDAIAYSCMYASQEASILAACRGDGRLHTLPINNLYEVIDPVTDLPVPEVNGSVEGELVVTSLYQGSKPLVRYRTGDMVRLSRSPDGSPADVVRPIGRVRDALMLGGRRTSAFDIEDTVLRHLPGCLDYRLVLREQDGQDVLRVQVEFPDAAAANPSDVSGVVHAVESTFGVHCEVTAGPVGSITSTGAMVSWKGARLHDQRSSAPELERVAALAIATAREAR